MKTSRTSRRATLVLGITALFLSACGGGGGDHAETPGRTETITTRLDGDQEAPARVNTAAIGTATFALDRTTRTLQGEVKVDGMTPTVAHIHLGAAGKAGAVVFPLTVATGGVLNLPRTTLTADQLTSLDAGNFYVNVHSAANPDGEIRGQIGREVYAARLNGAQESPAVTTSARGSGFVVLDPKTGAIGGEVEINDVTATAGHIHLGAAGTNGAIQVMLEDHGGHGHLTIPEKTVLNAANVEALRAGRLYFNVHSAAHPTGEIRGQIGRRVLTATATGLQEVPANNSLATGTAAIVYDPATRGITGAFTVTGFKATAAHLHTGAAGVNGPIGVDLVETAAGSSIWAVPANTKLDATKAQALLNGGLYANAHSATFPAGEIRGQLGREIFTASMTGAQETVPVTTQATGKAFAVVDPETMAITAEMSLTGMRATVAHIHTAALGIDGAVTFPMGDIANGEKFALNRATLTAAQLAGLRSGDLYFNAHSASHPTGEIRGQINLRVFAAAASGAQEVPANTSAASGRALMSLHPTTRELRGSFAVSGMAPTVAHIHTAPPGSNGPIALPFVASATNSNVFTPAAGTVLATEVAQALTAGGAYVNAHSTNFAAGEVRGQLILQ